MQVSLVTKEARLRALAVAGVCFASLIGAVAEAQYGLTFRWAAEEPADGVLIEGDEL